MPQTAQLSAGQPDQSAPSVVGVVAPSFTLALDATADVTAVDETLSIRWPRPGSPRLCERPAPRRRPGDVPRTTRARSSATRRLHASRRAAWVTPTQTSQTLVSGHSRQVTRQTRARPWPRSASRTSRSGQTSSITCPTRRRGSASPSLRRSAAPSAAPHCAAALPAPRRGPARPPGRVVTQAAGRGSGNQAHRPRGRRHRDRVRCATDDDQPRRRSSATRARSRRWRASSASTSLSSDCRSTWTARRAHRPLQTREWAAARRGTTRTARSAGATSG